MVDRLVFGKLLIDGTGKEPIWNPAILIQNGRISSIQSRDKSELLKIDNVDIVDYRDQAIIPGLIDPHVHLCLEPGPDHEWVREKLAEDDGRGLLQFRAIHNAQQALKGGITTLRDSGDKGLVTLALRDAIKEGVIIGPRVLASGMPITTTNGHMNFFGLVADNNDEIAAAVNMLCDKGVDWIKVALTGGNMTKESNGLGVQYHVDQLSTLVQEAHRRGRKVEAHILNTAGIEVGVKGGVDHIAHCTWRDMDGKVDYRDDLVEEIIRKGIVVEMTVSGFYRRWLPGSSDTTAEIQTKLEEMRSNFEPIKRMRQAGVQIAAHSDAGVRLTEFNKLGQGLWLMLLALEAPPMDVILAATKIPAEALGLENEVGTIEVGKQADMVAVAMNPLEDLTRLSDIAMVMKGGEVVCEYGKLIA